MARYRGIKDIYFSDQKVSQLTVLERYLFIAIWTQCDDSGVFRGNAALLKSQVFPYDNIAVADIEKALVKLCLLGFIVMLYQNDQIYFWVRTFLKHQSINRPSKSRFINPGENVTFYEPKDKFDDANLNVLSNPGVLTEYSVSTTVQISYEGTKTNEIRFNLLCESTPEITSFPDPNDDQEYEQFILKSKMGSICPLCGRKYSLNKEDINDTYPHIDHIIPRSRGGHHNPENLQVICARCNAQKYNTHTLLTEYSVTNHGGLRDYAEPKEREHIKEHITKRNIERESKSEDLEPQFEEFWKYYRRKENYTKAEAAYLFHLPEVGHKTLLRCAREHPKMKNENINFIPLVHNFLADEPWKDLPKEKKLWKSLVLPPVEDPISTEEARKLANKKF